MSRNIIIISIDGKQEIVMQEELGSQQTFNVTCPQDNAPIRTIRVSIYNMEMENEIPLWVCSLAWLTIFLLSCRVFFLLFN